jgi:hypothetical protein
LKIAPGLLFGNMPQALNFRHCANALHDRFHVISADITIQIGIYLNLISPAV